MLPSIPVVLIEREQFLLCGNGWDHKESATRLLAKRKACGDSDKNTNNVIATI